MCVCVCVCVSVCVCVCGVLQKVMMGFFQSSKSNVFMCVCMHIAYNTLHQYY